MKSLKIALMLLLCAAMLVSCSGGKTDSDGEGAQTGTATDAGSSDTGESYNYSDGLDENGYFTGVKATDYVTLCEYKGIVVPADEYTPTDSELESEVQSVLESYKENIKVTDRAVRDGDTVNIDYVGSVDGVEFEGGNTNGAGTDVTIGVTNYIDDFLEQLIGHKPGETFNVEVTFPDPYPNNTDLSGKDAVFVTTVNHISEEKYPELTDSFVAEKFADEGWKTVAELRAGLSEELAEQKTSEYLQKYITEQSQITEVPESVIKQQENAMLSYYSSYAAQYSMTLDSLFSAYGYESAEAFLNDARASIENESRKLLVYQAIAETENFVIGESEIVAYLKGNASGFDESMLDSYIENYGMPYMAQATLYDMAFDTVADSAVRG